MVEVEGHLPVPDLRVVEHLGDGVDRPRADVRADQQLVPLLAVAGEEEGLELLARGGVRLARGPRKVAHLHPAVLEVGAADRVAEVVPEPRLGAADGDLFPVASAVGPVVGVPSREHPLAAPRHLAVREPVPHDRGRGEERDGGVEVGDVDELAAPGPLAGDEGEEDPGEAVHGGPRVVGDDVEGDGGVAVRLADEVEDPGKGEEVEVVGGAVPVRPVLPEAAESAVDEAGVDLRKPLVAAAQALHHPRPEALHQHVVAAHEPVQDLLSFGRLEVEGEASLVAVGEARREGAGLVGSRRGSRAAEGARRRRLDLEHVRAHVGQHHGAERARPDPRQLEHPYSVKRPRHLVFSFSA